MTKPINSNRKPLIVGQTYQFPAKDADDDSYDGACIGARHEMLSVDCGRVFDPDGYIGRVEE